MIEIRAPVEWIEGPVPEVFELPGEIAQVKVETVPQEFEDTCREAAEGCPVEAISIEE